MEQRLKRDCKILFVEDEETDVLIFQRLLKKENVGMPVVVARDGREAWRLLKEGVAGGPLAKPYVIVTDLKMPGLSGLELIGHIRRDPELKNSVIFVLSSSDLQQDIGDAYRHNVAGYITKDPEGHNIGRFIRMLSAYCTSIELPT